jgi:hypothetical protein
METEVKNINDKLAKLARDVEIIKGILLERKEMEEVELTDEAKKELEEARKRKTKISHEEVKKKFLTK